MLGRAEGKAQSTLEALESAVAARGEAVEQCERMEADLTVCRAKREELEKEVDHTLLSPYLFTNSLSLH